MPLGRGTGTAVGLGAPVGTGNSGGGDPEPTGKGGVTPVDSGLWMGDAAARAERPARRMAVACMLFVVGMLFEVEGVVDVDDVYNYLSFMGSDSCCVDGKQIWCIGSWMRNQCRRAIAALSYKYEKARLTNTCIRKQPTTGGITAHVQPVLRPPSARRHGPTS